MLPCITVIKLPRQRTRHLVKVPDATILEEDDEMAW